MGTITNLPCNSFGYNSIYGGRLTTYSVSLDGVDANDLVGALDERLHREVLAEYFSHADLAALRHALNRAGQTNEGRGMLEHWARLGERILELEGDDGE